VLEDAAPARLLIIGTLRDVERPRGDHLPELLARLRRQPAFERLAIREMDDEEVRSLIESSPLQNFGPAFVRRLHDETKGNPFFIRETLRSLADVVADDAADDELQRALETLVVPEGVKELISRRMEKLDETTRQVLRTASVIGHEFELTVLSELVQRPIDEILAALEEAAQAGFVRELDISIDRFAFSHAIVREALYEGQGASRRIRLHHRIGEALEKSAESQPVNPAELAYHFFMSRSLTGPDKAFGYSIQAAEQAAASAAHGVAAEHYGRASSLLAADDPTRLRILPDFGFALSLSSNIAGADAVLTEAIDLAAKAGERRIELEATIERASVRVQSDPGTAEEVIASAQDTVPALEELGDDLTLAKAWRLIGFTHGFAFSRWGAAEQALVRGLTCAERAGSRPLQGLLLFGLGAAVALGATPVPDAIIRCRELLRYADGNPAMTASILNPLSRLEASRGEFDSGRELAAQARTFYERSRNRMMIAMTALWQSDLELLTGDHEAAESLVRPAIEVFRQFGEKGRLAGAIGRLASVLDRQGRDDEAQRVLALWRDPTPQNVVSAQVLLYATRAKLLANRGRHEEGLRLAREAVQLAERTDALDMLGDALMDLAEVERRAGATDESIATLERALAAYERKGNLASAGLTSRLLASVPR
jgi:tetratricopeptide (TPR) repeat protein